VPHDRFETDSRSLHPRSTPLKTATAARTHRGYNPRRPNSPRCRKHRGQSGYNRRCEENSREQNPGKASSDQEARGQACGQVRGTGQASDQVRCEALCPAGSQVRRTCSTEDASCQARTSSEEPREARSAGTCSQSRTADCRPEACCAFVACFGTTACSCASRNAPAAPYIPIRRPVRSASAPDTRNEQSCSRYTQARSQG
jgi:hypothetical protein